MNGSLILVRDGNSLTLLPEKGSSFSTDIIEDIDDLLSYQYKQCDWRGKPTFTKTLLYAQSADKSMIYTALGMSEKIVKMLRALKVRPCFVDDTDATRDPLRIAPDWNRINSVKFRPQQKECLKAISSRPGGVIVAPTGFGKTFLIGMLGILYPTAKITVCTKSVEIAQRIFSDLKGLLDSVGMVGGGFNQTGARVTVVTADSLAKVAGDCDFFFFDECHQAAAETYTSAILSIFKYARRYGFTATPEGRSDGADPALDMLFGPRIFELSYQDGVDLGLVVPIKVRWIVSDCGYTFGGNPKYLSSMERKRIAIWKNDCRNQLIVEDIRKQAKDASILVLVETIEHAILLNKLLPDFKLCYSTMKDYDLERYKSEGLVPPDYVPLSKKDRVELCQDFLSGKVKRVISTDVWSTGVDFPSLSMVYSVSGRVSKILTTQGAGRVSRLFTGKTCGNVVDVQDTYPPEFAAFSRKRFSTYTELGWEQQGYQK